MSTAVESERRADDPSRRYLVTSIDVTSTGTRLASNVGGRRRELVVATVADRERARRWLTALRRVDHVEVRIVGGAASCSVHGVGHRLPTTRTVPLAAGLGMGLLGVPLLFTREAA